MSDERHREIVIDPPAEEADEEEFVDVQISVSQLEEEA